jgi:hypothetical protein
MTNGDNARATGRSPTPNPEVQTTKSNERIVRANGGGPLRPYLREFLTFEPEVDGIVKADT